jgi:hypothetical protein
MLILTTIIAAGGLYVSRGNTLFAKPMSDITTEPQYLAGQKTTSTHAKLSKQYVSAPISCAVEFLSISIIVPLAVWLVFGTNPVCPLLRDSLPVLNKDESGHL